MELIIIFGPLAVGKMTVGQEITKKTGFRLFHNHMTIDTLTPVFDWGSQAIETLIPEFRLRVIEEAAKSDLPGLIHTVVWSFSNPEDNLMGQTMINLVEKNGGQVSFVELQAPLDVRKIRSLSENRAKHKPGNVKRCTNGNHIEDFEKPHRLSSDGTFPFPNRYLLLENSNLSAEKAADKIIGYFNFKKI